jgi:Putative DNA-binding domain
VPSLPRLTIPDIVADPDLIKRLVDEGETLYVERKERDPKDGLGATVASFANMLAGWLLIGVTDDRKVVGYDPPGTVDLQDYVRDLLRAQVDPIPPFAAEMLPAEGRMIGVVRVPESSDQPHVTREGIVYRRTHGGKEPVKEARDIIAMARRGERARDAAAQRRHLPLIANAMQSPGSVLGDELSLEHPLPLLEWIVYATPYTVTGTFADRALSQAIVDSANSSIRDLVQQTASATDTHAAVTGTASLPIGARVEPRARGMYCFAGRKYLRQHTDLAIDAGGVVAARVAYRHDPRDEIVLDGIAENRLRPLVVAVARLLRELDGYGRADVGLEVRGTHEVRGTDEMRAYWTADGQADRQFGVFRHDDPSSHLWIGGDLTIPAAPDDITELVERWKRELARAAQLPAWEPGPGATIAPEDPS